MLAHDHRPPADRFCRVAFVAAALFMLAPSSAGAQAQWMSNGVPVCALPECGGRQPMICSDGSGGAFVAWRTDRDGNEDLYVRRVLASGLLAPGWPSIGAPVTRAPRDQYLEDIVPDGHGGAFLVWSDWPNYDVYAQHVLGNGQIAAGWPANGLLVGTSVPAYLPFPRLLADGGGGVFVIWEEVGIGGTPDDLYAQHLNGDGTRVAGWPGIGLGVCTAAGPQGVPSLAADGQGGFIAAWGDGRDGLAAIFAQRITSSGGVAPGWPVNGKQIILVDGYFHIWGVVPDDGGGAYIGWGLSHGQYGYDDDVYAIRILADGSTASGWPTGGLPVAAPSGPQYLTSVVSDGAGGALLGWYDSFLQPSVADVQRLRPDGTVALGWPASGARVSDVAGWQLATHLAPDRHDGVYVALEMDTDSGQHGFVQHLGAGGAPAPGWPTSGVPLVFPTTFFAFQQTDFAITADGVGGAIVAWNDTRVYNGNAIQNQIYAQRYFGDGPTPALVALVSAEALPDRVALTWYDATRTLALATAYRRREGEEWAPLGRVTFDGAGRLQYEDRDITPGVRYAYRLGWSESGAEQFSAETWVDVPVALALALEGARPNPAVGPLTVAFTLPLAAPATLALLDVSGREVLAREVGSLGPGRHLIPLGECGCTPPGMYWLRLTQAGRSLVKRAAVIR